MVDAADGKKYVRFQLDNDGRDREWTINYTYPYDTVFGADGKLNEIAL